MDKLLDTTFLYLVPPERPEDLGITSSELAQQTGYTQDGARRILARQDELVAVVMRNPNGLRVDVYLRPEQVLENEHFKIWAKNSPHPQKSST